MEYVRPNQPTAHVKQIDGLRGIAVLAVVAYHLNFKGASGGFLGVDLFMAISGFLITRSLFSAEQIQSGLISFYQRRIKRLLPTALVTILMTTAIAVLVYPPVMHSTLKYDAIASVFYLANWRFIFTGASYFETVAAPSPLRHLWSLAIEEQFYIFWPIILYLTPKRFRAALALTVIILSIGMMYLLFTPSDPFRAYFATDSRLFGLVGGAFVAIITQSNKSTMPKYLIEVATLGFAIAIFFADPTRSYMYYGGFAVATLCVCIILFGVACNQDHAFSSIFAANLLRFFGIRSYSIYLWHWPIIVFVSPQYLPLEGWALTLMRLLAIAVCSELSFRFIEEFWRWKKYSMRVVFLGATASMFFTTTFIHFLTLKALPPAAYLTGDYSIVPRHSDKTHRKLTIRVVGDSIVDSLKEGFLIASDEVGIELDMISISGCGFMPGATLGDDGSVYLPSLNCPDRINNVLEKVDSSSKADILIWLDAWDALGREIDGRKLMIGRDDTQLIKIMNETAHSFLSLGNKVLIVTIPERAQTSDLLPNGPSKIEVNRYQRAIENAKLAGGVPNDKIFTLDLNSFICNSMSPCLDKAEQGQRFRPTDGIHFEGNEVRVAVAKWILERAVSIESSLNL